MKHYFGDVFEGMDLKGIIDYCWGHVVVGIGKGEGRDELGLMLMLYQAYCVEQRQKESTKDE